MTRRFLAARHAVLFSLALATASIAQNPPNTPDGPTHNVSSRVGGTDPAGSPSNYTLFRDQQLFVVGAGTPSNRWPTNTVSFDANLTPTGAVSSTPWLSSLTSNALEIQAVSGRFLRPDKDDIALIQRSETDPSKLAVRFRDGSGLTTFGALHARAAGFADFFSASQGDLDRLYDANGNYHDEVVTAWMQSEKYNFYCPEILAPHITVLNYNNGADPSIVDFDLSTSGLGGPDAIYTCEVALGYYNDPAYGAGNVESGSIQPVDNIIATAIGDFDGDGYNEIALAYIPGNFGAAVNVVIFRYQNDGTNASLTPVNSFQIPRPDNRSMVGTLTLAAGNFDGSGSDQLLVGSAYWWGTKSGSGTYDSNSLSTQPVAFLLKSGKANSSITGATSSGTDKSQTQFTVSLPSGAYVPRSVTISGASGKWTAINGTWPVTLTDNGFSIQLDSSSFGPFNGQTVQFTAAAALRETDSVEMDAFPDLPGFSPGAIHIDYSDQYGRIRTQAISGLFHYDPSNGFDYRRREIAIAWNARPAASVDRGAAQDGDPHVAIIQVTNDDKLTIAAAGNGLLGSFQGFQTLQLAGGAFVGDSNTNDPTWSLFAGASNAASQAQPFSAGEVHSILKVSPIKTDPSHLQVTRVCSGKAQAPGYGTATSGIDSPYCNIWGDGATIGLTDYNFLRLPAIASDLNGNSLRLGAPVHVQLVYPAKADFILEQPPQHVGWLPGKDGTPGVVNISRFPTFNTAMTDTHDHELATNSESHSDWTVGASEQASVTYSQKLGVVADEFEASAQAKVSASEKVSYDYDSVSKDYSSHTHSYWVGGGATTGTDDDLIVEGQLFDIWRYRIYGAGTSTGDSNKPYAYYDVSLPGPSVKSTLGGLNTDWYQPTHEIGNILSYPDPSQSCNPPLGPITIKNADINGKLEPIIACEQHYYNGNSGTVELKFTDTDGKGGSTDYTHKVHADADLSATYTNTDMVAGTGVQWKASLNIDIHGGRDWGEMDSSGSTTTDSTAITLDEPQGDSEHSYPFWPIFYDTPAGALKVAYGVGALDQASTGTPFWVQNYGGAPDPALNLPHRFDAVYGPGGNLNDWTPDGTDLRKKMKGFVVRATTPDSTGYYPLNGNNPQDGDTVLLDAVVSNYSLSRTAAQFTVQFSIIPYDSDKDNEVCPGMPSNLLVGGHVCPPKYREMIGTGITQPGSGASVFSLGSRQSADAYLMWNTKGKGPQSGGATSYRLYVDLIPMGTVLNTPELPCETLPCEVNFNSSYDKIVDPGQNKEGWALISVAAAKPNQLSASETDAISSPIGGSLSAQGPVSSPASVSAAAATGDAVPAFLFQALPLRIAAFSNAISTLQGTVTIYDGEPGTPDTKAIAAKTLYGMDPDGTSAWFTWIPVRLGLHHLYATTETASGTRQLGDLVVNVTRAPGDLTGTGRVDTHDLNILSRDLGKSVAASACGSECDLDGDGTITEKDAQLLTQLCDSPDCSFAHSEYVGGSDSALEPDMRTVHAQDEQAATAYLAQHPEEAKTLTEAGKQAPMPQLYEAELNRKQALHSVLYYYRGTPVTNGPFAPWPIATAKTTH